MQYKVILLITMLSFSGLSFGQGNPGAFHGAMAEAKTYKAVYFINDSSTHKIKSTLRNIKNALEDPRLTGKLEVELVAFGDGVAVFKKENHFDTLLLDLQKRGVILAECLNTLKEKKISKDELWDFVSYVPTGNGEIIIRQAQGWAVLHP